MFVNYTDIISKLGTPVWFTQDGYPRYCEYHPSECGIYHKFSALILVKCQSCGRDFKIGTISDYYKIYLLKRAGQISDDMSELKKVRYALEYCGDPPNIECCSAGPTMTVEHVSFLEIWKYNDNHVWEKMDV